MELNYRGAFLGPLLATGLLGTDLMVGFNVGTPMDPGFLFGLIAGLPLGVAFAVSVAVGQFLAKQISGKKAFVCFAIVAAIAYLTTLSLAGHAFDSSADLTPTFSNAFGHLSHFLICLGASAFCMMAVELATVDQQSSF